MKTAEIDRIVATALSGRHLLDHPFYRRWEAGEVTVAELAAYAGQYRHFERHLPGFLGRLSESLPEGPDRDLIEANRADELGDPTAHVELFERFAQAVGAGQDPVSPATGELLSTYDQLLERGPGSALAGFLAYEVQAADIARSKANGLRRHYGLDDRAVSFWDHHARVDVRHAGWAAQAAGSWMAKADVASDVRRAADAWWAFLDERQALAQASGG